jgi:radical SAM/Cys-rich protein
VSVPAPSADARPPGRGLAPALRALRAERVTTLQINVGRICNQACRHCHVGASPTRTELMSDQVLDACLSVLERHAQIATLDVTAGAPELHPRFREIVTHARRLGRSVIVRHNLTVQAESGHADLPAFFAERAAELVCSLPHYLPEATDRQRGRGVFNGSIRGLRALNAVGYGFGGGLKVTLVANPLGAFLPPPQQDFERDMRAHLKQHHDVAFDRLITMTNMPIGRFADWLERSGQYEEYLERLERAFNPETVPNLMCRSLVSVSYDGQLFDCDFNQMLELGLAGDCPKSVLDFDLAALDARPISVAGHCLGCTAGAGSSCGGALTQ